MGRIGLEKGDEIGVVLRRKRRRKEFNAEFAETQRTLRREEGRNPGGRRTLR
jgi:hypothetical protein